MQVSGQPRLQDPAAPKVSTERFPKAAPQKSFREPISFPEGNKTSQREGACCKPSFLAGPKIQKATRRCVLCLAFRS